MSPFRSDAVVVANDVTVKIVVVKVSLIASKGSDVNDITICNGWFDVTDASALVDPRGALGTRPPVHF